ncbi:MAG: hypothetical protein Q8R98_22595 [Rubrivivax sp.]|nr:hypothetical protein [Rubrivivax sp.]MDP3225850.1 hypothetical protein [Rubrivivax sp.]MDP3614641.1 hypothetical protein [Rubrivivax sp.]
MRALLVCAFAGLTGLSGAALAQALPAAVAACRHVADPVARLACYDAIGQPAATSPVQRTVPAAVARPEATPAAVAVAPAAAPPAAKPAAPADFGLPPVRPPAESDMVDSRISGRFEGWDPGTRLTLANGQVWEVLDNKRVAYDLNQPAVRVKRGMLGSFFMEIDGVSATPRVRRVK